MEDNKEKGIIIIEMNAADNNINHHLEVAKRIALNSQYGVKILNINDIDINTKDLNFAKENDIIKFNNIPDINETIKSYYPEKIHKSKYHK